MAECKPEKPEKTPKGKQYVAGTDLYIGCQVRLKSGGPVMTVVGDQDDSIRVSWFAQSGDEFAGDPSWAYFPRHALEEVEE